VYHDVDNSVFHWMFNDKSGVHEFYGPQTPSSISPFSCFINLLFSWTVFIIKTKMILKKRKENKKNYASSKKLLTLIKEKGPLGKKSPFTSKEESSQCG